MAGIRPRRRRFPSVTSHSAPPQKTNSRQPSEIRPKIFLKKDFAFFEDTAKKKRVQFFGFRFSVVFD
jgi:hypothetical protein